MSLFRFFTPDWGLDALSNLRLMVTPPKYFNDPFEFSPIIKCKDPVAYALRKFREVNSRMYFNRHRTEFPPVSTFGQYRNHLKRRKAELLKRFADGVRETDRRTQHEALNMLSDVFGVVCFAGDGLDQLMWGHYTLPHAGLAIEFREDHLLFSGPSFLRMEYSDERVTYDASDVPNRAAVELFARRKGSRWAHEKESRLILRLRDMLKAPTPSGDRYFLPIPPDAIVSLTLGLRASEDLKNQVMGLLRSTKLRHVRLFQIAQDDAKAEFDRLPL